MTTIRQITDFLKQIAPLRLAEEWDNVGLLLGDEADPVQRVLTCLTLTTDVADEAAAAGAGLIVTHHPVLFKPVKKITSSNSEGRMLLNLIRHGISVYSPHTAWDNSTTGINQQLADLLELQQIGPLRSRTIADQLKLVTFVPEPNLEPIRAALWSAGAGVIGNYRNCSFNTRGVGTFFGSDATNPTIGQAGRLEHVDEVRLEVVCATSALERVLVALRANHPYEEPAIDVFPVKAFTDSAGAGRHGLLPQPITLGELVEMVSVRLKQRPVQYVGDPSQAVMRVGIACGAAAEFLPDAHRVKCQVLLTGESRFHACLEARDLGMGLILPGHFATERFAMETLAERLGREFPSVVVASSLAERDPIQST